MQKRRLFVIAFVVAAASAGIPSQVSAAPRIPRALTAARTVISQVNPGQSKTISVAMPWRANMIGVSFLDASNSQRGVAFDARAHTATGWSLWEELGPDDNGTTGVETQHATKRVTTEALWVGTADQVQVRVSVGATTRAIHDVRVHLINTLGDAQQENLFMRAVHALGRFLTSTPAPQATQAEAATTQPAIIWRAQWGANPAYLNLPCPGNAPDLKVAFVHHTDTTNSYTKSQSAGIVRGIYMYHTNTRGYCDIAYNFLIDKYGQIFEGRSGGVTNNVIGAHTGGYNYGSVGVALLGNYSTAKPTSAILSSLQNLLAWRLDIAHVPPTGVVYMTAGTGNDHTPAGTVVKFNRIAGHRDASYTSCPGSNIYPILSTIRSKVSAIGQPKIYLPSQSTATVRPDGDTANEAITISASFGESVRWTLTFIDATGAPWRTFTGTGTAVSQPWGASTASGALVPTGAYTWQLTAIDSIGHSATPVSGVLNVVTAHPDGALLSDSGGKYVVSGGAVHAVGPVESTSTFGTLPAVATGPSERTRYASGSAYALRPGTLLVGPDGSDYMWSGQLRRFAPTSTFATLGYTKAISVTQSYLSSLTSGPDITDAARHPGGGIVKSSDGSLWVIGDSARRPISSLAAASWFRPEEIVPASAGDLALPTGSQYPIRNGSLVAATDGGASWLIEGGEKHRFVSTTLFGGVGFTSAMLIKASSTDLSALPTGPAYGSTWESLTGDWNGNKTSTVGAFSSGQWYLRASNTSGGPDLSFAFGNPTDIPIVGDWNGDGTVTPGVVRGNHVYLRNSNTSGTADITFQYGNSTDKFIVGDWDGNGTDTLGVVRGTTFYLRDSNTGGVADLTFEFSP